MSRSSAETEAAKEIEEYFGSHKGVLMRKSFPVRDELSKYSAQRLASGEAPLELTIIQAQLGNLYAHRAIMQLTRDDELLNRLAERPRGLVQAVASGPVPKGRSGKQRASYWERNACILSGIRMMMARDLPLDRADGTASHSAISIVDEVLRQIGVKGLTEQAIRQIWYRSVREEAAV